MLHTIVLLLLVISGCGFPWASTGASCCWSKWGDKQQCGDYPAAGRGGLCSTDWEEPCSGPGDCPTQPVPPPPPTRPPTTNAPTAPPAPAHVVVSGTRTYNVTAMAYGVNLPNYVSAATVQSEGHAMIQGSGASHIRWPGGNWANMLFWNDDYSVCPYFTKFKDKNAAWTLRWEQAAAFAQQEGIKVLWQMNAAVGFVCGADTAAKLASDFVTAATSKGVDVSVIEVGNENYGKWEVPYPDKPEVVSAARYATICTAVVKAVKSVNSSVLETWLTLPPQTARF